MITPSQDSPLELDGEIPAVCRSILGPTARRFEPVATCWLSLLCQRHNDLRSRVLGEFARLVGIPHRRSRNLVMIDQMSFGPGIRGDLIIQDEESKKIVAIVEAKVGEVLSAFQLCRYFDVPEVATGDGLVVALSPRPTAPNVYQQEADRLGVKRLTWSQWLGFDTSDLSPEAELEWGQFTKWCRVNGIFRSGTAQTANTREQNQEQAGRWLSGLREALPEWDPRLEGINGIAPRLRIGRPEWRELFGPIHWHRLLVYFHDGIRYGKRESVSMQLMLFHKQDLPGSDTICRPVLPAWLETVESFGLTYYGPRKGRRANRAEEKVFASEASAALKQTFLVTSEPEEMVVCNFTGDVRKALPMVRKRLSAYDDLVSGLISPF